MGCHITKFLICKTKLDKVLLFEYQKLTKLNFIIFIMSNKTHTQNLDHFCTQEGVPPWVVLQLPVFICFSLYFLFHRIPPRKLHLCAKNRFDSSLDTKVIKFSV